VASGTEATGDSRAGALGEPTRARSAGDGRSPQPNDADLTEAIEQEGSNSPAAQRLATHPGVGTLTALAFVLIIREVERFHCGNQVASYLGLVPAEDPSGDRQRLGHISKQGNSLLHTLLRPRTARANLPE
jgi:transposase